MSLYHPWLRARTRRERMIEGSRTFGARLANELRIFQSARFAERRLRREICAADWKAWRLATHAFTFQETR
jgi:hypothetical protein